MNDVLRWMVIHTSSVSDQLDESLAKFDFQIIKWCHQAAPKKVDPAQEAMNRTWWDSILQELVASKCDLQALVAGLIVLTSPTTPQEATIKLESLIRSATAPDTMVAPVAANIAWKMKSPKPVETNSTSFWFLKLCPPTGRSRS